MSDTALEACCEALSKALPAAMEMALKRLDGDKSEAELHAVLTTAERLFKMAKLAAEAAEKADPEGDAVTTAQMRRVAELMTEHVHRIADQSPYADQIKEVLG
ncbi:hypothetical protein [Indioceanicola profundi]|uniref:hypothetical protein n=1 Tax=Indioceanicola profundi TaxID=2220096 RepID=UPI000E6ACB18|nr:hypothetical protein [Indioceanicola profundi]